MRIVLSLFLGGFGFLFGGVVTTSLVVLLLIGVGLSGDPRGGETTFKIAWSVVVFGIGPFATLVLPMALGSRRVKPEALTLAIVVALASYGFAVWELAPMLSAGNDCMVGVTWPVTSVAGCD